MCSKDFLLVSEMAKFSTGSVAISGHSPEMMKKKFIHFHVYIYHFATYWFICLETVCHKMSYTQDSYWKILT